MAGAADYAALQLTILRNAKRVKRLDDVAYILGENGYMTEASACVFVNKDTATDPRLLELVVNNPHGRWQRTSLMHAAYRGMVERMMLLLSCGADTSAVSTDDNTAVQWALEGRQEATARVLCARPDFDAARNLHIAAWLGDMALVEAGIEQCSASGSQGRDIIRCAIAEACRGGHRECALRLCRVPSTAPDIGPYYSAALIIFAEKGELEALDLLLSLPDVDVNAIGVVGSTALTEACRRGHAAVVARLLSQPHVEVNLKNGSGHTALVLACAEGHAHIVRLLLDVPGIVVQENGRSSALVEAAASGHGSVVQLLLAVSGVQPNLPSQVGETALTAAAARGRAGAVAALMSDPRVDVNAQDQFGNTALVSAVSAAYNRIVQQLLADPRVDVNARGADGWSALAFSTMCGLARGRSSADTMRLLLAAPGIDVNAVDRNGCTALMNAAIMGLDIEVALLLAAPGVDVNAKDNNGRTAADKAAVRGYATVAAQIAAAMGAAV